MRIRYGANEAYADVTSRVAGAMLIPPGDFARAHIFGCDPAVGVVKHVVVEDDYGVVATLQEHEGGYLFKSDTGLYEFRQGSTMADDREAEEKLKSLHKRLRLYEGSFEDEYAEQIMAVRYVKPTARVLEIGGNIGRNSCVIASLLDDSRNLVVIESDPNSAAHLRVNRHINGLGFHIIPAAISKRRLVQVGWNTKPIEDGAAVPEGWTEVATRTWGRVVAEFGTFDTLVADCEGALFHILRDEPGFLRGITTVILENDFGTLMEKEAVDAAFRGEGLRVVYQRPGPWGPCAERFYEVWSKL
jgi:FkbM family methyltransferase